MTETPNQKSNMPASDAQIHLEQASNLMQSGRFQEAIPLYESALASLERTYGEDQPELAECLQELGQAYEAGARLSDALRVHTRRLRMSEEILGKANPAVVEILFKLTQINETLGRPADALSFCEQALQAAKQCLSQDNPLSQQIIDRYRYLTDLAARQIQIQGEAPRQFADQSNQYKPISETGFSNAPFSSATNKSFAAGLTATHLANDDHSANNDPYAKDDHSANNDPYAKDDHSANNDPYAKDDHSANNDPYANDDRSGNNHTSANNDPYAKDDHSANNDPYANDDRSGNNHTSANDDHSANDDPYANNDHSANVGGNGDGADTDKPNAGKLHSQTKPSRPGRIKAQDAEGLSMRRLANDFAVPAIGLVTVIALVLFFVLRKGVVQETDLRAGQNPIKTAVYGRYRTADGSREVQLVTSNLALLATTNSAMEIPYVSIGTNWTDLISAMASSVSEKQIWAEKKESELKTEDEIVYYSADGAETLVIAKMRRLAAYAQAYFLRAGEYPKAVSNAMASEFSYINPLDGKGASIQIRTLLNQSSDGVDAKKSLEAGLTFGDEPANTPCKITCYDVVEGAAGAQGDELKATKFFIRGCDRNGIFLASAHTGTTYVVTASDASLSRPVAQPEARAQKVKPKKTTRLWIVSGPPCPILLIHYGLPLLLFGLAIFAFLQSGMAAVDIKGRTVSSGSRIALILAAICLALAVLVLAAQFVAIS